ncbi:MAG: hypothetical protein WBQ50_18600, partial [Nocardioides sp.]
MSSPRTHRVRLLSGVATGALALSVLAVAPLAAGAEASSAAAQANSSARAGNATVVRNEKQLRKAVRKANRRSGTDKIRIADDIKFKQGGRTNGGPKRGDLDVTDDLVVRGKGNTLNAKSVDRIFDVRSGVRLEVGNLVLRNGSPGAGESGGAIRSFGTVVLQKSK